jgi:hypothetical protein
MQRFYAMKKDYKRRDSFFMLNPDYITELSLFLKHVVEALMAGVELTDWHDPSTGFIGRYLFSFEVICNELIQQLISKD